MKKKLSGVVLGATVALGSGIFATGTAQALPANCHRTGGDVEVIGTCDQGTGQFKIRLDCQNQPDPTSDWTPVGQQASVSCFLEHARGVHFELKD